MIKWLEAAGLAALLTTLSTQALAQWPTWPDRGMPRTEDGTVNLEAPTPRTADGRPDLSGLWENRRPSFASSGGAPGSADDEAAPPPPPPPPPPGTPPLAMFFDIGANLEGGAPYRPWAKELRDQRVADGMKDNPDAHCLPLGYMQLHLHPQPRKIVQSPDQIIIMYEANYGLREIFMDGRPLPDNEPQPWWYGYSVGHWEGDDLVVESTHFRDGGWLDVNGSPLTDEGKIIERFRRPTFGTMEIDITIDDPKAYTEPFTLRVNQQLLPDEQLIEFICNENEKSSIHFDP
jgi:hypothetical protein